MAPGISWRVHQYQGTKVGETTDEKLNSVKVLIDKIHINLAFILCLDFAAMDAIELIFYQIKSRSAYIDLSCFAG